MQPLKDIAPNAIQYQNRQHLVDQIINTRHLQIPILAVFFTI